MYIQLSEDLDGNAIYSDKFTGKDHCLDGARYWLFSTYHRPGINYKALAAF
jgi:hypothetical protein